MFTITSFDLILFVKMCDVMMHIGFCQLGGRKQLFRKTEEKKQIRKQ